ncbi:hypothetical protein PR003_g13989 [Phytophthora rubi]|uniref:Uncharacterized protein n=1 Tax=Phytophthora rubi TaxID=129364 RepID=A0A6A4EVX8_9STRA|nr:hypothetical protein PR003_g13989 [Phytophthora rubi]
MLILLSVFPEIWLAATLATGLKTSVVEYADSSCAPPAVTVSFTSAFTCAPQPDHYNPTCVNNGAGYSVSDCTDYTQGGRDDFNTVNNAFDGYSYLAVEKYVTGRCGQYDSVTSAMLYRLDENCYSNAAGTESHRLSLGHSAVITTYSDPSCTNVKTTTTVRQAAIGLGPQALCVDEMTAFYGGSLPNLTAVAIYDDNTCSSTPTQLRLSQDFACLGTADAPCQVYDNSRFSTTGCTRDLLNYSAAVFGTDSPYVIVGDFPNPWCGSVENVTVYHADGACHTSADGATSFRATVSTTDSTATLTTYSDPTCAFDASNTSLNGQTLSSSPCLSMSVAIFGLVVAVAQFVSFTGVLICTPQLDHFNPTCVNNGAGYSVLDCTDYNQGGWDDFNIVNNAFDGYSYLGVDKYLTGRCGRYDSVTSAMLYRLDENRYPNAAGTESHRLSLGHSAVITTYSDPSCMNVKTTTTVRQAAIGLGPQALCVDEMTAFYGGSRPNLTAVAIYDDNTCSSTPTQLRFSQDFACLGTADAPCQVYDNSRFSTSGCTDDFLGYSAAVFGTDTPYVIIEDFPNSWCGNVENVTVYHADGACHTSADGTTSFRATVSTADYTANLTMYSDPTCTFVVTNTSLDSQTLSASPCLYVVCNVWFGCGRRYTVGGLGGSLSLDNKAAVVEYEDNRCVLTPIKLTILSTSLCTARPGYTCDTLFAGMSSVYQVRECINSTDTYVTSKFRSTPYFIVENYANGTNCQAQTNVTMYAADGKCHLSIDDGAYFTIVQRSDGTVIVSNYPTQLCKDTDAVVYVFDYWNVNAGTCMGDRIFRTSLMPLATNVSTPATTTTPPTYTPTPTPTPTLTPTPITEVPVEDDIEARLNIMFPAWLWDPLPPQVFVNDGRPHHRSPNHRRP